MMRDDVRKLIGGYATGSLTEAERALLFEAALDDQELFDELAREDALRDLLEQPGAKQRLIASLETARPKPARVRWWAVAAAGIAAVLIASVLFRPANKPVQVADALRPVPQSAPVKEAAEPPQQPVKTISAPPARRAKLASETQVADARLDAKAEEAKDEKKAEVAQAEAAVPPPQLKQLMASKTREADQAANGRVAGAAALGLRATVSKAARFAFDYALEPGRQLRITPATDGYLSVDVAGLRAEPVMAGISISFRIPNSTDAVSISFSALPNPPSTPASLRDQPSGTVEDPNPSVNSHLEVTIRLTAPAR